MSTEGEQTPPPDDPEDGSSRREGGSSRRGDSDRLESSFRRMFAEGLSGLLESGGAIRRGQEAVSELASGTKEEVVRRVSAEIRGFLDRLDVTDLARQVLEGMTIDVTAQVKFRRNAAGALTADIEGEPEVAFKRRDPKPER